MIRLALRVSRADAELVLAELLELAPAGVEELELDANIVEYAVYGAPGELPQLPDVRALAGGAVVEISTSEIADDWPQRWREFHRPVLIESPVPGGAPLRVRPPWESPQAPALAAPIDLEIDPGQAFGTGAHATTRLCLELLLELHSHQPTGAVLDVGTGSGVLAIAAAKLGYEPLLAIDNERESVQAAAQNASRNGVVLDVQRIDLRNQPLPWLGTSSSDAPVPIVLANLLRPLLIELAAAMARAPAHLVAGGLLAAELDEIAAVMDAHHSLRVRARRERDGWGALWLAGG